MKQFKIKKQEVKNIDMSILNEYDIVDTPGFSEAGQQAYKFYAYLSTLLDDLTILEVGTRYGKSAVSLAYNEKNKVITYDILEQGASRIKKENLECRIGDFMEDPNLNWDDIDIILIDVDPHDGIKERVFLEFLESKKWEGLLLLDDILPNWPKIIPGADPQAMHEWWNGLTYEKYDVSDVGHFSGTGLVVMGDKCKVVIENE